MTDWPASVRPWRVADHPAAPLHYRIEVGYGSRANRKWRWIASALRRNDAEQIMFREWLDRPRRVAASDGSWASHVPFGKLDPGEQ